MLAPATGAGVWLPFQALPEISVIIVNHNGRRRLDGCLSAVTTQDTTGVEVILVDNASSDGSAELVRERFPGFRIALADRNLGNLEWTYVKNMPWPRCGKTIESGWIKQKYLEKQFDFRPETRGPSL